MIARRPLIDGLSRKVVVAGALLILVQVAMIGSLFRFPHDGWNVLGALIIFGALAWWVRGEVSRIPLWFVIVVAVAVQLPGLFGYPLTSDDAYRYVWDARVQLAGIDPYHYAPLDPALRGLQVPELFPDGRPPLINRPTVPTIYPPLAQLWFVIIGLITPLSLGTLGVQVGAALVAVVVTGLLARCLGERPGEALLFGACPAVGLEAANGAHLDVLAALGLLVLIWAMGRGRFGWAGLGWGLAIGVKLVPLLLVPLLLRRGRWRIAAIGIGLVALAYLPHLVAVGSRVVGFLPGYWQEEGYQTGGRFALLIFLPEAARTPVALALAAGLAILALVRSGRDPLVVTACWLYGCSFLIATPIYPWYLLPFVVVAILARRLEWLALWPAAYLAFFFDHSPVVQAVAYAAAGLVIALRTFARIGAQTARESGQIGPSSRIGAQTAESSGQNEASR